MEAFGTLRTGVCEGRPAFALALHGGASNLRGASLERRAGLARQAETALRAILEAAGAALAAGATALDTVEACVRAMEDSGAFNAGRGATTNSSGEVQLDAAVMDGATGRAGAIAAVSRLRDPVHAARLVMERSPHVLLVGADAERFAVQHGATAVDSGYFRRTGEFSPPGDTDTVGAVAVDRNGSLAAATSTGGIRGKLPGRVGDSPLIGAGTFANDRVAVSGTGQGEYFLRLVLAHDVAAMTDYLGCAVGEAVNRAIRERLGPVGGYGGLIAVDRAGHVAMAMNTSFMPRGSVTHEQQPFVATGAS